MSPPTQSEQELCTMRQQVAQHMQRIVANCLIIITALFAIMLTPTDPEPYHILTLLGEMWVDELFNWHHDHIHCELGLFHKLIFALCSLGVINLKYVTLEEQWAIFLYMSVAGLTIWHTGRHFQQSDNTMNCALQRENR